MKLTDSKLREFTQKLMRSRARIVNQNGFFGRLLLYMKFQIDERCKTAATDGENIIWGPDFLEQISDLQTDIVMMHEILHVVLQHCIRGRGFEHKKFNYACDAVVNAIILETMNITEKDFDLGKIGRMVYEKPNGESASKYTAEEIYQMLNNDFFIEISSVDVNSCGGKSDSCDEENPDGEEDSDCGNCAIDGKSCGEMNTSENSIGSSKETSFDNFDDHGYWNKIADNPVVQEIWNKRIVDLANELSARDPSSLKGNIPLCIQRMIDKLKNKHSDWRSLLDAFVQEDVCDYSFNPPDRRFDGQDFFLPDFNEKEESVKNILFMIDASGSMSDNMITDAFAEIKSAIDQFGGKLEGFLGFIDAGVKPPVPFASVDDLLSIRPVGGGGTDFDIIFEYVKKEMSDNPPDSIVILTDGYASFPNEEDANGIPVLWMINNYEIDPPWGQVARMEE